MRGHDEHRVGAHRKYLAVDLELLERFPNRCSRFVRVVRRFSVAFVAAKRPLKPLRSSTSAALAIFFLPYYAGLKARTTRTVGYTNCGIALAFLPKYLIKLRLRFAHLYIGRALA